MCALHHHVAVLVDQRDLLLGVVAPEDEHGWIGPLGHCADHRVGDLLPALGLVGVRLAAADRQHRVEQEDALLGPRHQIAVVRDGQAELVVHLLVDVAQGRRRLHARLDREAQTVPLALAVVGVLAEDEHLHPVVRRGLERGEDLLTRRIHRPLGPLLLDEIRELLEVGLLQLFAEDAAPGLGQQVGVGHVHNLRYAIGS